MDSSPSASFFFRTRSGHYGFAHHTKTGFVIYHYYVDVDGSVNFIESAKIYNELDPALLHVDKLESKPSQMAIASPNSLKGVPTELSGTTAAEQEAEIAVKGKTLPKNDGSPKSTLTELQENVLAYVDANPDSTTRSIAAEFKKPTAGINSALEALKRLARVESRQDVTEQGKPCLKWTVAA